jgi:pimeloyl-ACP methyl ester carboxylesterase
MIGHSLGGLVALETARRSSRVQKVATLCTPFSGTSMADLMRWVNPSPLFDVLSPSSTVMTNVRTKPLPCPVFSIVGTSGLPLMRKDNDGAVTVEAQTALRDAEYKHYGLNHFEVLMDEDVAVDIWNAISSTV